MDSVSKWTLKWIFWSFLTVLFLDRMDEKDKNGYINSGHASQALQKMDQFLRNRQLCDVVLIAGNRRIPAHRLVLCSLRYNSHPELPLSKIYI